MWAVFSLTPYIGYPTYSVVIVGSEKRKTDKRKRLRRHRPLGIRECRRLCVNTKANWYRGGAQITAMGGNNVATLATSDALTGNGVSLRVVRNRSQEQHKRPFPQEKTNNKRSLVSDPVPVSKERWNEIFRERDWETGLFHKNEEN